MLGFLVKNETVERKAQESVAHALEWLEDQGIQLGYSPTIAYVDAKHPIIKQAVAVVDREEESFLRALNLPMSMFCEALYKRSGLEGNVGAVAQVIELNKDQFLSAFDTAKTGADITLYRPAKSTLKKLDDIMVHEVWHLVEKGLLNGDDFIHEGTATYVANRFAGRESQHGDFFWKIFGKDMQTRMYEGVAEVISRLYGEQLDLRDLLKKSKRKGIVLASQDQVLTPMRVMIEKTLQDTYKKLHEQTETEGYHVVYEGAFKQATNRGRPNTEMPFPFVVAVLSPEDALSEGRIYGLGGTADFQGKIAGKTAQFVKRYHKARMNSITIEYKGQASQDGVYVGDWNFDSDTATAETGGKFIMTRV